MDTIFDLSNIAAGLILSYSVLMQMKGTGEKFSGFVSWLNGFRFVFGGISLVHGLIYLFRSGCALFDITGMLAGLLLLSGALGNIPGIGKSLEKASRSLAPFSVIIGVAAIVVGIMGLLDIHFLC